MSTRRRVVGDFFLHADDARTHLQPFTDWRFYSPVSYWDPAYFGRTAMAVEAMAGAALVALLWRRFNGWRVRSTLALTAAVYGMMIFGAVTSNEDRHSDDQTCAEEIAPA